MNKSFFVGLCLIQGLCSMQGIRAQVFRTAEDLPRGTLFISTSPSVYFEDETNTLALFLHSGYGLGGGVELGMRIGIFEESNYIGGRIGWTLRRRPPYISFSVGAHYVDEPGFDGTLILSSTVGRNLDWYGGLDVDLIMEDDPDLPAWVLLGFSYDFLEKIDLQAEFNAGIFEIARHALVLGFVFYL